MQGADITPEEVMKIEASELNEQQHTVVKYQGKHLLVNSGPGSGKTFTLIERVKWLIEGGADPATILLLTFTNRAADIMADRIADHLDGDEVLACTFHSFCYRILKECLSGDEARFTVADADDQLGILRRILARTDARITPAAAAEHISLSKSRGYAPIYHDTAIYGVYEGYLRAHNLMDFGDLQIFALEHLDDPTGYKHILVDEFHDTSPVQMSIVQKLEGHCDTLTVVCDDQQSIYGWRGADIGNILELEELYPDTRVLHLERNYRSTKRIVASINHLIGHATEKLGGKILYSRRKYGTDLDVQECASPVEEAELVAGRIKADGNHGEHMVLCRTNAQMRNLEQEFLVQGIPYRLVAATSFYRRKEIKDVVAYLRWIYNPRDDVALRRIINLPRRGIGKATIDKLSRKYGSLSAAVERGDEDILAPLQSILTTMRTVVESARIHSVMNELLDLSGYREMLAIDTSTEGISRSENVDSLLSGAAEFEDVHEEASHLEHYLQIVSLLSDADAYDEGSMVNILTIHSSKGTEARIVHIVGAEEGVIPHQLSLIDGNVEEERRLMYVAISRAMDEVYITWCSTRMIRGKLRQQRPSRFIEEIQS